MHFTEAPPPHPRQTQNVHVLQPPLVTLAPLQRAQPLHRTSLHPLSPMPPHQQIPSSPSSQSFHPNPVQPLQQSLFVTAPPRLPAVNQLADLVQPAPPVIYPQRLHSNHVPHPRQVHVLALQSSHQQQPSAYPQPVPHNSSQPPVTQYLTTANTSAPGVSPINRYAPQPPPQRQPTVVPQQKAHYHTPTQTPVTIVSPINPSSPHHQAQRPVQSTPMPQNTVPPPRDAAVVQYWKRLHALLTSARSFALELQPNRAGLSRPSETPRQIAYDLQGLTASAADACVAKQSNQYRAAYDNRAAGDFIEYGVASGHAVWAANILSVLAGASPPAASIPDGPLSGTCPDRAVEDVRVRVFEAEVSCLPVEFVEALLKRRRSMRRFKSRIELCVRILLALEGRGRRPTQASLDRIKLQLEKADIQARAEAEREAARKERERQKQGRVKKTVIKAEDSKKRKRQQSAQANFMKQFVKKDEKDAVDEEDLIVVTTARDGFAATLAQDRDVMSVAWWLRAEMPALPLEKVDDLLCGQSQETKSLSELVQHLDECSKRRAAAERRIHVVLREYRRQRKMHTENRTPMFVSHRADVRGRSVTGPVKLLQFDENYRPAYFGTFSRRSRSVSARRPFGKDKDLDYECDSADEWDEDEEGEDLLDVEADKELASEEAELRRLYGSDDEDDDDFLDDADVDEGEDDDGNRDENENVTEGGAASQEVGSPMNGNGSGSEVIDLPLIAVNDSRREQIQKRLAQDDNRKRSGKRRKGLLKQSVVINFVSIPDGEPSPLDRFAVEALEDSQPIQMFNPFVYTSSTIVAEHLKAKPPSTRAVRASNMDESTKLDLAAALMRTGSTKDKIVLQFCEHRKMRGLAIPTKAEIMRAIGEIATKEKRNGETKALWHLTDQSIAKKIAQMNSAAPNALPRASAPVVLD